MARKIPAIKGNIGSWVYYTAILSFKDIAENVKAVDKELHDSKTLSEAIQRSLTSNYLSIKNYILHQEEMFFNSIVLAIYDGDPNWIEVELEMEDQSYYDIGFLSLSGDEKIFPVDGQHRVHGIKKAIEENSEFENETISVIFIGHQKTDEGMRKSRRLFNALNRYAKPVNQSDIIALDEDDSSAISTRYLLEESESVHLFKENRVVFAQQKAIPDTNKDAFTSLITLYQANRLILKHYLKTSHYGTDDYAAYKDTYYPNKNRNITISDFIRYRPSEDTLKEFVSFNEAYWESFVKSFEAVGIFIDDSGLNPATQFRNREHGGHLLFRPVGIVPFVEATLEYVSDMGLSQFDEVFEEFRNINYDLNSKPWKNTVWSILTGNMESSVEKTYIRDMILYLVDNEFLNRKSEKRMHNLKLKYADKISYEGDLNDITLNDLLLAD